MTSTPPLVRVCAVAAPVLLLLYGILRLIDGRDGHRGPGLAWNLGHAMFFLAFVLFGILTVGLRQLVAPTAPWQRIGTDTATVAGVFRVSRSRLTRRRRMCRAAGSSWISRWIISRSRSPVASRSAACS